MHNHALKLDIIWFCSTYVFNTCGIILETLPLRHYKNILETSKQRLLSSVPPWHIHILLEVRVRSENSLLEIFNLSLCRISTENIVSKKHNIAKFLSSHCRDTRRKDLFAMVDSPPPPTLPQHDTRWWKKGCFLLQFPKYNRDNVQHNCESITHLAL